MYLFSQDLIPILQPNVVTCPVRWALGLHDRIFV
eukprot:CAMPEP_0185783842 /NCGR_PEP_ID=MMETSP1174-20130828/119309_1 /TAXON_ID=35687 /ORGANISM="Dictyocha speculum, Strain CCMP1381" /LENGTH=33 /DNA_ID= /DNA_START= /DNA_END= /DNA_ORIENTATION=